MGEALVDVGELRFRRRAVGDRRGERRADGVGQRLLDLRAGARDARPGERGRAEQRCRDEIAPSAPRPGAPPAHAASLAFTKASARSAATTVASASRRPWYSACPF